MIINHPHKNTWFDTQPHKQPPYKNIYSNIRILFDWFIMISTFPPLNHLHKNPTQAQNAPSIGKYLAWWLLISTQAQNAPSIGTKMTATQNQLNTLQKKWKKWKEVGIPYKTISIYKEIWLFASGKKVEKGGKSGKPYKTIYKYKDINNHQKQGL